MAQAPVTDVFADVVEKLAEAAISERNASRAFEAAGMEHLKRGNFRAAALCAHASTITSFSDVTHEERNENTRGVRRIVGGIFRDAMTISYQTAENSLMALIETAQGHPRGGNIDRALARDWKTYTAVLCQHGKQSVVERLIVIASHTNNGVGSFARAVKATRESLRAGLGSAG